MSLVSSLVCRRCFARAYRDRSSLDPHHLSSWTPKAAFRTPSRRSPITPPDPSTLPRATPAKHYRKTRRWLRRLLYTTATLGSVYLADRFFYASSLTRSAKTFGFGLLVALDYKINFRPHPPLADSIEALHTRSAERLFTLLRENGGLYLKVGQALAMQSALLPPQFQDMFSRMFDDAPQNPWADVERVVCEDFGKSPEEVFGVSFSGDADKGVMERTARASASVAQVHWARLTDGREVAIKIQKREIARMSAVTFSPLASTNPKANIWKNRSTGTSGHSRSLQGHTTGGLICPFTALFLTSPSD